MLAGGIIVAMGIAMASSTLGTEQAYGELATETIREGDSIDWAALEQTNADVVGWLSVEGTRIDYPVVQGGDDGYYLSHDLWGNQSEAGCPFLAAEACPDEGVQLVFGHHMAYTTAMFSELAGTWSPEAFSQLGYCVWMTRKRVVRLEPLCALRVDAEDDEVRRVSFSSVGDLRRWLVGLSSRASARGGSWETLVSSATRAMALVTCSSNVSGQGWRTAVIFVG